MVVSFLAHCMECQRGLAAEKLSVRPAVCPPVKRMHWRKICPDFYTIRKIT